MATKKISGYTEKTTLADNDLFLIEQAAGTYRKATSNAIKRTAGMVSNDVSTGSVTTADSNSVIGSITSTASGSYCSNVIGSNASTVSGIYSTVIGSYSSTASGAYNSAITNSQYIINSVNFSLAMGYAASGSASTSNRKIHLYGQTGNVSIAGTLSSSVTFTDFAEMFKNNQGEEIEAGYIVTLDGDGIRIATDGDDISGVVSYTAVVLAGDSPFCWAGRYLYDEFGRPIMEEFNDPERGKIMVHKENPDYNPELEQIPRIERPLEYTPVGLIGQVLVRVSESVVAGDKLKALDGVGIKSETKTGLKCMKITVPYNSEKGYAVAKCLINVSV